LPSLLIVVSVGIGVSGEVALMFSIKYYIFLKKRNFSQKHSLIKSMNCKIFNGDWLASIGNSPYKLENKALTLYVYDTQKQPQAAK
jgi:hypothetical protein